MKGLLAILRLERLVKGRPATEVLENGEVSKGDGGEGGMESSCLRSVL